MLFKCVVSSWLIDRKQLVWGSSVHCDDFIASMKGIQSKLTCSDHVVRSLSHTSVGFCSQKPNGVSHSDL